MKLFAVVSISVLTAALSGCGGPEAGLNHGPPVIVSQPSSTTTPLGSAATFTVSVEGDPSSYQWERNGVPVSGGNATTLTIANVSTADEGSVFDVVAKNQFGSIKSGGATLHIGPRSPAEGDLRFKLVGSTLVSSAVTAGQRVSVIPGTGITITDAIGAPLPVGSNFCVAGAPQTCSWPITIFSAAGSRTTPYFEYRGFTCDQLSSVLSTSVPANAVVLSIDFHADANGCGLEWGNVQGAGVFTRSSAVSTIQGFDTMANQLGAAGAVVTATWDSGSNVNVLAYQLSSDAATAYEVKSVVSTLAAAAAAADQLASGGYIVTSVGTLANGDVMLVGTKVKGDSLPRGFSSDSNAPLNSYAAVGMLSLPGNTYITLSEK